VCSCIENHIAKLHQLFCACDYGSVLLLWRHCDKVIYFLFVNDVMFLYNAQCIVSLSGKIIMAKTTTYISSNKIMLNDKDQQAVCCQLRTEGRSELSLFASFHMVQS